jgi:hypothetical protein
MNPAAFDRQLTAPQQAAFKLLICGSTPETVTEMNEARALRNAGSSAAPHVSMPLDRRIPYYEKASTIIKSRIFCHDELLTMQFKLGSKRLAVGDRVAREALKIAAQGTELYAANLTERTFKATGLSSGKGYKIGSNTYFKGGQANAYMGPR